MRVIHVTPLVRGVLKEELTYFSAKHIELGTIVTVPIRNKTALALVISSADAATAKTHLKNASYAIKKIESVSPKLLFLSSFAQAAAETAKYFATTTGDILHAFTPKTVLESFTKNESALPDAKKKPAHKSQFPSEKLVFQADDEERFSTYKSLIREEFAKNNSVFLCLPTTSDIEHIAGQMERGIKEYTYTLSSAMSKKALLASWQAVIDEEHPVLIIATGTYLSVPRPDIATIIVEKEHSSGYRTLARPFVDIRVFAEYFAEAQKAKIIFGDILLRPETLYRRDQGELVEFSPLKFRILSTAKDNLVDMRAYSSGTEKGFRVLSDELVELIERTKRESEELAILVSRRGLSSITTCSDCGTTVTCPTCNAPFVLHKDPDDPEKNIFLCHKCGRAEGAMVTCTHCGSWRLTPLGIGIEKAYDEIRSLFPSISIFRVDSDSTPTPKKVRAIVNEFFATPGSILIGTEMMLRHLNRPVAGGAVLSIDSLFTLPDFRITEKVFHMLLSLYTKARKEFLVQTRNPEQSVWAFILQGNLLDFYRDEIRTRKEFGYPPFMTAVKLTTQGKEHVVKHEFDNVEKLLAEYEPIRFSSFTENASNLYRENILIRLPAGRWPDEKLLGILRSLSPAIAIKIDPEDLL